jgi:hypothetical protein
MATRDLTALRAARLVDMWRLMTSRLAAVLLVASVSACVTDGSEIDLDALPPYDTDTKADNSSCTDAAYRTFLQTYFAGAANAGDNPCKWGNDASYRIWAYVAGEKLAPMLEAYNAAATKRFNGQITREQAAAAGTLTPVTRATLDKLAKIRPAHAGKVGVGAWREYLYKPAFDAATRPIAVNQPLPDARDQWTNEVTAFEEEWLAFVERSQPKATEPHAFTIWWQVVESRVKDATASSASSIAEQAAVHQTFMARLAEIRPAGAFDDDAVTFQTAVTSAIAMNYASTTPMPEKWRDTIKLRPTGGGAKSFATWATAFADVAVEFNARTRTDAQRELFALLITSRPCASGPDVDTIVQRLTTGLASAGTDPSGNSLSAVAVPVACPD